MRGDASRQVSGEGRNSPNVTQSNGAQQQQLHINVPSPTTAADSSLHPPGINGISSNPHGRTSSFSYSSVLASSPGMQQSPSSATDQVAGNNNNNGSFIANNDKPFRYSRDEMLNIWKNNAAKYKSIGIPLEFEKHEAFTSEEPLEPALLTEMSLTEKEVTFPQFLSVDNIGIFWTYEF